MFCSLCCVYHVYISHVYDVSDVCCFAVYRCFVVMPKKVLVVYYEISGDGLGLKQGTFQTLEFISLPDR